MAYVLDFSGIADVNPYVNSDFTSVDGVNLQVLSGALTTIAGSSATNRWVYNVSTPTGNTISVKATVSAGPNDGDHFGVALLKSNGEGYILYSNFTNLYIRRIDSSGTRASLTPSSDTTVQPLAAGDTIELQLDLDTNTLRSYHNDVLLATKTDTTYTQGDASGDFHIGLYAARLNNGVEGITQFESSSIGTAPSYTITSIDGDNNVQAGQTNVDIVMTATTGVTSVTLGGETLTINGVS